MAPIKKQRGRKPNVNSEDNIEIKKEVKKLTTQKPRKSIKTQEIDNNEDFINEHNKDIKLTPIDKVEEVEDVEEVKEAVEDKVEEPKSKRGRKKGSKNKQNINDNNALETEDKYLSKSNMEDVLAQITKDAELVLQEEKLEEELLPKKKGRKPKNKIFDYKPDDDEPKKRGRKPKEKFGVGVDDDDIKIELPKKSEDYIILNLPIKSDDLKDVEFTGDSILTYNEVIQPDPKSYSPKLTYEEIETNDNDVITLNETIHNLPSVPNPLEQNVTKIVKEKSRPADYTKQDLQRRFENIKDRKNDGFENSNHSQVKLMTQFTESAKRNEWPKTTNIYCFWCCHSFTSIPWGIPIKYVNNLFHVDGNFCSPECAAAYNFDQKDFNMWERYMLLNLMYNKINYPSYQKLKLALPKRLLVEYGGNMSIEEFRNHCQNYSKDYIINFPPMVAIQTMAEEVNLPDQYRQKVVYMDPERVDEAKRRCEEQDKEMMEHGESLHNCFKRIANMA